MDFDGVRALVVLPELPVAGGAVGGFPASVVPEEELDDGRVLPVEYLVLPDDSFGCPFRVPGALMRRQHVLHEDLFNNRRRCGQSVYGGK
jgi:hypothetical protein